MCRREPDAIAVFGLQILSACLQRGNMGNLAPIIEQAIDAETARELLTNAHSVAADNRDANVERRATQALHNLE